MKIKDLNNKILFSFLTIVYGAKWLTKPELNNFKSTEFGPWFPFMDNNLLLSLDKFREIRNKPVVVSPAIGATGRVASKTPGHDIIAGLGTVHAVDVFPLERSYFGLGSFRSMNRYEVIQAIEHAKQAGFNAIGIYPDWIYKGKKTVGMHLEIRDNGEGYFEWGAYSKNGEQVYTGIEDALEKSGLA